MSEHQTSPDKLTPGGVLERLLTYADRPWKAIVMIVLLVLAGIGWLLWDQRARIADAVLHEPITSPALLISRFVRDADQLLRDTRGDVAVLIELHLTDNVSIDRIGIDRDGTRWVPVEGPQPALSYDSAMPFVVRFLRNETVCFDTDKAVSEDARSLLASGYKRGCVVSVPPVLGVGVGALLIAWKVPLLASAETRAGIAMSSAAMKFATW